MATWIWESLFQNQCTAHYSVIYFSYWTPIFKDGDPWKNNEVKLDA